MTYAEMNEYIRNYLENDKTHSAIMLTGPWGSGKSFYVKNSLIPALVKDGKNRCIMVSLYGMKTTLEISKSIYLELRAKWLQKEGEKFQTGKSIARVIFRGVTSVFNININSSEEELNELYSSIDLSDRLIILEDAERSSIDILELLGYVNGLVEQDGVKVLIVSYEDALIRYSWSEPDKKGNQEKIYTKETLEYLRIKEKTVGDTIRFEGNYHEAIKSIIHSFSHEKLGRIATPERMELVETISYIRQDSNLRTFTYACQKIVDIFDKIPHEVSEECLGTIFISVIAFASLVKNGVFPPWTGSKHLSYDLGFGDHPLYRCCYDYISSQKFVKSEVHLAYEEQKKHEMFDRHSYRSDPDIALLLSFYTHTEVEVRKALSSIEARLEDPEEIPFYGYRDIAVALVQLHTVLDYDYTYCKNMMINNIRGKASEIDGSLLFLGPFIGSSEHEQELYKEFANDIVRALNDYGAEGPMNFSYIPTDLEQYEEAVAQKRHEIEETHVFFSRFDSEKLFHMLMCCSSAQLESFRGVLWAVYRHAQKETFDNQDRTAMQQFSIMLEENKQNWPEDKIVQCQLKFLISNLRTHVEKIS